MKPAFPKIAAVILAATAMLRAAEKPNVVFFIADDMRPRHFNCLHKGKARFLTPNIDRLAREGTIMNRMHVCSPICTPSRYNVLTGRYASRATNSWFKQRTKKEGQTVVEFNTEILPTDPTLPKLLQKAGYETGMVGKNHVVEVKGLKRFKNFDASARDPENVAILKANHDHVRQAMREIGFDYADHVYHNNPDFLGLHEVAVQNMDWITEGGVNFIRKPHDRPIFLYFATTVPHGPTEGPRSWNADPHITPLGYIKDEEVPHVQPPRSSIPKRLKAAGFPVNDDTCNILWLDDAVGALLKALEDTGKLDNTVFFFFSDHGQNAKGTIYQGGVFDPCVVWRKGGFKCGHECGALVQIVDFAPTILDFAKYKYPKNVFDGESFKPYLDGKQQKPGRVLYFELGFARGVRKDNWKYMAIRYPAELENMSLEARKATLEKWNAERRRRHLRIVTEDPAKPFSHLTPIPGGGDAERESTGAYPGYYDRDQLYNLATDPGEQRNLAKDPKYQDKLKEMRNELRKKLETLPGDFPL